MTAWWLNRIETLDERTQRWVAAAVDARARVTGVRRMVGGISSDVHQLTVETPGGKAIGVVLRRNDRADAAAEIEHEANILTALARHPEILAPELLAVDVRGLETEYPALLMTRLAGDVLVTPRDREDWLRQMAAMLPLIHQLPIAAAPYEKWIGLDTLSVPAWAKHPAAWSRAVALVREASAAKYQDAVFIHRDFQHFNLLWSEERLSGVIDWVQAAIGPPDVDVAHCRLNLAVLFSAEVAERFRMYYEAAAGRRTNPIFDLESLLGYDQDWKRFIPLQVGDRMPVDLEGMDGRIEDLLLTVLRRC